MYSKGTTTVNDHFYTGPAYWPVEFCPYPVSKNMRCLTLFHTVFCKTIMSGPHLDPLGGVRGHGPPTEKFCRF